MTKERWGMMSEHLKTKGREARNSKDSGGRVSGGRQSWPVGWGRPNGHVGSHPGFQDSQRVSVGEKLHI